MSGGYFDYRQFEIGEIVEVLDEMLKDGSDEEHHNHNVITDTVHDIKILRDILEEACIRLHELDWYISGDTGPESYRARLEEKLKGIKTCSEQ